MRGGNGFGGGRPNLAQGVCDVTPDIYAGVVESGGEGGYGRTGGGMTDNTQQASYKAAQQMLETFDLMNDNVLYNTLNRRPGPSLAKQQSFRNHLPFRPSAP
jgi:hypothetical protein